MQILKICNSKYICDVGCVQITLNMNNSSDPTSHLDCVFVCFHCPYIDEVFFPHKPYNIQHMNGIILLHFNIYIYAYSIYTF